MMLKPLATARMKINTDSVLIDLKHRLEDDAALVVAAAVLVVAAAALVVAAAAAELMAALRCYLWVLS